MKRSSWAAVLIFSCYQSVAHAPHCPESGLVFSKQHKTTPQQCYSCEQCLILPVANQAHWRTARAISGCSARMCIVDQIAASAFLARARRFWDIERSGHLPDYLAGTGA